MGKNKKSTTDNQIAQNKRASFDYSYLHIFEAGIALEGWEVKSLRAGKANLTNSYIVIKSGEAFWVGGQIIPLMTASTHIQPEPSRTRKLLLNRKEIDQLMGGVAKKGLAIVAIKLYWKHQRAKLKLALARGKKLHDKRDALKEKAQKMDESRRFATRR